MCVYPPVVPPDDRLPLRALRVLRVHLARLRRVRPVHSPPPPLEVRLHPPEGAPVPPALEPFVRQVPVEEQAFPTFQGRCLLADVAFLDFHVDARRPLVRGLQECGGEV